MKVRPVTLGSTLTAVAMAVEYERLVLRAEVVGASEDEIGAAKERARRRSDASLFIDGIAAFRDEITELVADKLLGDRPT